MVVLQEILFLTGYFLVRVGLPLLVLILIGTYVQKAYQENEDNKRNMA
jgi:hypothetical protein